MSGSAACSVRAVGLDYTPGSFAGIPPPPVSSESPLREEVPPPSGSSGASSRAPSPLPYTVRVSPRARRVTLRVLPERGLVVTVPTRFAKRDIPPLVESHRGWVESTLAEQERLTSEICRAWPPRTLELAATGRRVTIVTRPDAALAGIPGGISGGAGTVSGRARWLDAQTLELPFAPEGTDPAGQGALDARARTASVIAEALRAEGRRVLVPRLHELAARHGLRFSRVAVRGQRSVWGSCSSRGTVSLNWKLLFLRPALVDYVLLHELVHTRHLDHSAAFWSLLVSLAPAARALDRELRSAGRLVPPWLELAGKR